MVCSAMVQEAALELYVRYGALALDIAKEHADRLTCGDDFRAQDTALLILSEVERLVGRVRPTYRWESSRGDHEEIDSTTSRPALASR